MTKERKEKLTSALREAKGLSPLDWSDLASFFVDDVVAQAEIEKQLEKLEQLVPGSIVRLSTGEEYRAIEWTDDDNAHGSYFVKVGGGALHLADALPLLRDAVKGGAQVLLPAEIAAARTPVETTGRDE